MTAKRGMTLLNTIAVLVVAVPAALGCASECLVEHRIDIDAATEPFDPDAWAGPLPRDIEEDLAAQGRELRHAMRNGPLDDVAAEVARVRERLGRYAGVPERRPEYGSPIEPGEPDLDHVIALWKESFEHSRSRFPWRGHVSPEGAVRDQHPKSRLRVSLRLARAFLQTDEAGIDRRESFRDEAFAAFDYMLAQQGSNGIFGYPYLPDAKTGVAAE